MQKIYVDCLMQKVVEYFFTFSKRVRLGSNALKFNTLAWLHFDSRTEAICKIQGRGGKNGRGGGER